MESTFICRVLSTIETGFVLFFLMLQDANGITIDIRIRKFLIKLS